MHGVSTPPLHPYARKKGRTGKGRKGRTEEPAIAKTKKRVGLVVLQINYTLWFTEEQTTAYICQNADALAPTQTSWIISEEVRGRMYLILML